MSKDKFKFDKDFQFELLKFTALDKNGYKAIQLYESSYFGLLEHAILAQVFKRFFKKHTRIPKSAVVFKQELRNTFKLREYAEALLDKDRNNILKLAGKLYKGPVKDGDILLEECGKFASFVELKDVVEKVDITDYDAYDVFSKKIQNAIIKSKFTKEAEGIFLVRDIRKRQIERQINNDIYPTPFRQLNAKTNAGGYEKGSIIVIIDKEKKFKSGFLVNAARGYMRMRKKILLIDLENGERGLSMRFEQSVSNKTKREILGGEYDKQVQKTLRKYARMGAEVVIKRLPAFTTTANTIRYWLDHYYREYGIMFQQIFIDYIGKMGAISGAKDDLQRISDAYVDVDNLATEWDIEHVWTAHHITREGAKKRMGTVYESTDIAKCIDIVRHSEAIWGLNQTPDELKQGVLRMELVEQRDGVGSGKVLFHQNIPHQRINEFSKKDIEEYANYFREIEDQGVIPLPKSDIYNNGPL